MWSFGLCLLLFSLYIAQWPLPPSLGNVLLHCWAGFWFVSCSEATTSQGMVAEATEINRISFAEKAQPSEPLINPKCKCGGPIVVEQRIVAGFTVAPHTHPWMALILYADNMHCGGTIINDRYILTAGHCLKGFSKELLRITVGGHYSSNKKIGGELEVQAAELIYRDDYNTTEISAINDIGLIRLTEPLIYNNIIKPICLPQKDADPSGKAAFVVGWGKTQERGEKAEELQSGEITTISADKCRASEFKPELITDTMFCGESKKTDACQGDSGGPLVTIRNKGVENYYEQIGIVSWGMGCARPGYPGVYTQVSHFIDWIKANTQDAVYCIS